jgi:hypothetical protein
MMQTCGAGSNWGSAGSSTGQICILGKQASLVAACKRFIRPQVTCKLRKSTGGPCLYLRCALVVRVHAIASNGTCRRPVIVIKEGGSC